MALANGADTYKMKFGHRGINQPVKYLTTGRIYISAQNHGYAVDEKSLEGKGINISHISMNDGTIEGLEYTKHPTFTVQYHPEACPGPGDHDYLFKHFVDMMEGR
jgi:carbamoyl-phosphate synthase small subunit